ncbi:hypothetical protein [uncultured Legionella sp.]|uniref:hypothetical protein n=1 Tax=uncultured Legionella sp. TaxID=210934 RepID=UPI00262F0E30|nr:hypothetical protein [uncultured Legionella sp.]
MPFSLLIPAAAAAASSSGGLITLIASTTLALTGGLAVGAQFSSSSSSDTTSNNDLFSSLMDELSNFSEEAQGALMHVFRDFKEDKKVLVESTATLSALTSQLNEAAEATKKNTRSLQQKVDKPLERLSEELGNAQKKTDEVVSQLKKYQQDLTQANTKIGVLTHTLKKQEETVTRLNAEIVPLTKALSIQIKEKEHALKSIEQLKNSQESIKKQLAAQVALNKRLSKQKGSLEHKLSLVEADYQKTMAHKQTLEMVLADYKSQETSSLQRIKELDEACNQLKLEKEGVSAEEKKAAAQQIKDLMSQKQQLQEALDSKELIKNNIEQANQLLEQDNVALQRALTQLNTDYEHINKRFHTVCSLTHALKVKIQEQADTIALKEDTIATLSASSPSNVDSLGLFAHKASVTRAVVPTELSPGFN